MGLSELAPIAFRRITIEIQSFPTLGEEALNIRGAEVDSRRMPPSKWEEGDPADGSREHGISCSNERLETGPGCTSTWLVRALGLH